MTAILVRVLMVVDLHHYFHHHLSRFRIKIIYTSRNIGIVLYR
jgi:hypothetical protein